MNQEEKAVEVEDITKRYDSITAVNHVSFSVDRGEIFGFLGPNGAGKTTLVRMLTTLIPPTSGTARVGCCDIVKRPEEVRLEIGVVPQALTSDLDLTGYENMDIYGRFYGIPYEERQERIHELLGRVALLGREKDLVATYSGGMRRRLEIARALVHKPRILFLDEPTIGLDPQSRLAVWDFLRGMMKEGGMTTFLTTHYMEEADGLCNRVAIIDAGKIIAMGSPAELKSSIPGNDVISLVVEGKSEGLAGDLKSLPFVHRVTVERHNIHVAVDSGSKNLAPLIEQADRSGAKITSVSIHEQSLEDVFIHYTGKTIREEETRKVSFLAGPGAPPGQR